MQPTTTRIPAVLADLVSRFTAALAGVQVIDGPRAAQDLDKDVVLVGLSGDGEAVTTQVARQPGLGNRYAETFDIWCLISIVRGDEDMRQARERAGELLAAIDTELRENVHLDGLVDRVELGSQVIWGQAQSRDGAVCEVAFQVSGSALL